MKMKTSLIARLIYLTRERKKNTQSINIFHRRVIFENFFLSANTDAGTAPNHKPIALNIRLGNYFN